MCLKQLNSESQVWNITINEKNCKTKRQTLLGIYKIFIYKKILFHTIKILKS